MALSLVGQDVEVSFYARQVGRHGSPVLVLGCANGRVAFELASRGHTVAGVDPSRVMIQSAEERRAREPRADVDRLRFSVADLRSLRLSERFPLVLAPQNAIGLMGSLGDLGAFLATVAHHLEPEGAFIFDVVNPGGGGPLLSPRALGGVRSSNHEERERGARPPAFEPPRPPFVPHLRERRRVVGERSIRRLKLRQFEPGEIDAALEEAGFEALERYGGFDLKPFDDGDPVQIVVAAKASG